MTLILTAHAPIVTFLNRQAGFRTNISGGIAFIVGCYIGVYLIGFWGGNRIYDGRRWGWFLVSLAVLLGLVGLGSNLLGFPWTWGRFLSGDM